MPNEPDIEAAVHRVMSGDRDAFGPLVERYLPMVYAIAHARAGTLGDVDDVVQEAYLKAFRALPSLREPKKFPSWLAAIARNACTDHAASRSRGQRSDEAWARQVEYIYVDDPAQRELHEMVEQAVRALDPNHREILLLYYFSQQDLSEIETILDITRETAKKRLQRARAALEAHMSEKLDEVLEAYRPARQKAGAVMGAIAVAYPEWAPVAATTTGIGAKYALLGVDIMSKKLVAGLVATCALVGIGIGFAYKGASPAPAPGVVESKSGSLDVPSPAVAPASGSTRSATPGSSETPETIGAEGNAGTGSAASLERIRMAGSSLLGKKPSDSYYPAKASQRSEMAGGGPQRTGYYNVNGPLTKPNVLWETTLGGSEAYPGTALSIDALGRIFASHGESGKNWLTALSAAGEKLWDSIPVSAGKSHAVPGVMDNGYVVQKFRDGSLRAFDAATGQPVWTVNSQGRDSSSPLIDSHDDVYIAAAYDSGVMKIDGTTGELIWPQPDSTQNSLTRHSTSPSLSLDEQTIYAARVARDQESGYYGDVIALNAADGSMRWTYAPEGLDHFLADSWVAPTVGGDGTIYIQDAWSGQLFAIGDGGDHPIDLWAYDPISVGAVARYEETGEYVWTPYESSLHSHDAPRSVATDGDSIYMSVYGSPASVHAVNTDGSPLWHTALVDEAIAGSPVVTENAVYLTAAGDNRIPGLNALYCLDKNTGAILWQMPVSRPHGDVGESVALGPDGTIFLMSQSATGEGITIRALR